IGSNLTIDAAGEMIALDVAIRSQHPHPLYAPAVVWVEGFVPPSVSITNADYMLMPPAPSQPDTFAYFERFGFDYSGLLGDDGVLEHGETSGSKTWIFHDPGLVSFSFQGRAEFGTAPDLPRIAGVCFVDENLSGYRDPGEPPLQGAIVTARLPGGDVMDVMPGPDGHYALPVEAAGLYELRCDIAFGLPPLPPWTTPNPREVLLTPGPDGMPNSFLEAHFGIGVWGPPPVAPPIVFTDLPPGELHFGHWMLFGAEVVERHRLLMHVGYSGCQPDHPFTLYASGGFMEPLPPQINVVLVHEIEEDCDAWFESTLTFDLYPLWESYLDTYGPGMLLMNLIGIDGAAHQLAFPVFPED
ncbi:hypothetical protein KKG45_14215, partial [bacterium]|nr:hypothetical protein [bacterium]